MDLISDMYTLCDMVETCEYCNLCGKYLNHKTLGRTKHSLSMAHIKRIMNLKKGIEEYEELKKLKAEVNKHSSYYFNFITYLPWQHHMKSIYFDLFLDSNFRLSKSKYVEVANLFKMYYFRETMALLELAVIKFAIERDVTFENIEEARNYSILDPGFIFKNYYHNLRCSTQVTIIVELLCPYLCKINT